MPRKTVIAPSKGAVVMRSVVLCDGIRREVGGLKTLVGCRPKTIFLRQRPAIFTAMVVAEYEIAPGFTGKISYRLRSPTMIGEGVMKPPEGIKSDHDGAYGEAVAPLRCLVEGDGLVQFDWKIDGGRWSSPVTWLLKFSSNAADLPKERAERLINNYWNDDSLPDWAENAKLVEVPEALLKPS